MKKFNFYIDFLSVLCYNSQGNVPVCWNGRQGRLKIFCQQWRAGSTPAAGTKKGTMHPHRSFFASRGERTRPEPLAKAYRLNLSPCGEVEFCSMAKSPGDDLFVFFRRLRPPDTVRINTDFKVYLPSRTKKHRTTAITSLLKFVCFYKCIF